MFYAATHSLLGMFIGAIFYYAIAARHWRRREEKAESAKPTRGAPVSISALLRGHFEPSTFEEIEISERRFPPHIRADLEAAIVELFQEPVVVSHFSGLKIEYHREDIELSECFLDSIGAIAIAPKYAAINIGEDQPRKCLSRGIWLLRHGDCRYAVLLTASGCAGVHVQLAVTRCTEGTELRDSFFGHLATAVQRAASYRGKILSLERSDYYSGQSSGIKVHKLRTVERDQVILPRSTLDLLDRNIIDFASKRQALNSFRMPTKKGLLFYGPPGTGKTHTIHYLLKALPGHTALLITSEQVGLLSEYMSLARLLQPSIVVIEDADLIARDREHIACEEMLLNQLLNEMDGLREDAAIFFLLTTNRPETLESALASRPGRIDQAIEFPYPDREGRDKLIRLYSGEMSIANETVRDIVQRTENVSAAFLKELMRRSLQFQLARDAEDGVLLEDVQQALDEMLFMGGTLNAKLLGADSCEESTYESASAIGFQ